MRGLIGAAILLVFFVLGGALAGALDSPAAGGITVVVGWLLACGWWVFAVVQTVIEVIRIVQLATGVISE